MNWIKKGLIYTPDGKHSWNKTHAQVPKSIFIKENLLRIYYGTRDEDNRTRPSYIEVDPGNPSRITYVHKTPVIEVGEPGSFDDRGVMPACIIRKDDKIIMYYTGWSVMEEQPYRVNIGIAVSRDEGKSFEKVLKEPMFDAFIEPLSYSQPFVLREGDVWRMWYSSFTEWAEIEGVREPRYNIKCAESEDGLNWEATGITSLENDETADAYSNVCVWKEDEIYKMLYSYRKNRNYRNDKSASYRIGYAESADGIKWTREDTKAGIDISQQGWDSEMIAYPDMYSYKGKKYLLYNGNGFGKTGFGYAVSEG